MSPDAIDDDRVTDRLPIKEAPVANPTFGEWLRTKLDHRHWSQAELVRRANISSGTVSNWILEKRVPDPISCESIALAMDLPLAEVLNAAGYPVSEEDARAIDIADDHLTDTILFAFARLSPVAKNRLLRTITDSLTMHFEAASEDPTKEIPNAARIRDGRHK
jgi:transcriptional regulator with XRE-family HTH domain